MHVSLGFMVYNNHPCPQALPSESGGHNLWFIIITLVLGLRPQSRVVIDHNLWFTIITLDLRLRPQSRVVIDHNLWFTIITLDLGLHPWSRVVIDHKSQTNMHYVIYILQSDWSLLVYTVNKVAYRKHYFMTSCGI